MKKANNVFFERKKENPEKEYFSKRKKQKSKTEYVKVCSKKARPLAQLK